MSNTAPTTRADGPHPSPLPAPPAPPRAKASRAWAVAVALVIAAGAGAGLLMHMRPEPGVTPPVPAATSASERAAALAEEVGYVGFATAVLAAPLKPLPLPGRIAFDETRTTRVMAPIGGLVDSVLVRVGDRVVVGQRLMSISSSDLVGLIGDEKRAQNAVSAQTRTLDRIQALVDLRAAPLRDLIAAQHALRDAQLEREAAELKRKSLKVSSSDRGLYWLEAPRTGIVVERNTAVGQSVGPDHDDPLLVIADLDEVLAIASVPESEIADLAAGQHADVLTASDPDHPISGEIARVSQLVDPERHTVDVRVRVANTVAGLRPNAWVQVAFDADTGQHVVLPASAVVRDDQSAAVFVRGVKGLVERRPVVVGRQRDSQVEVLSGVAPGETVVVRGAVLLLNALTTTPVPHD